MTNRFGYKIVVAALPAWLALSVLGNPAQAEIEERRSPLADSPAIRRRLELRDKRFELGVGTAVTLGQDFYHAALVNLKLAFHINDWLAIGGYAGINIYKDWQTSFGEELLDRLPNTKGPAVEDQRTPTKTEALNGMNKIGQIFGLNAEITPFTGKLSLFGSFFANYDMYFLAGPGFINFEADGPACTTPQRYQSCPITGMRIGPSWGTGIHAFVNEIVALNLEFRDVYVKNNASGRDENGTRFTNENDEYWDHNFTLALNVMFFLPTKPRITD